MESHWGKGIVMGRASVKENKNDFQLTREKLGLSREEASELLGPISADKLEKIENERMEPDAYDVLLMAEGYKEPNLCNYYCSQTCPIGKKYVPEIKIKDLSQIVIEMLASLNKMDRDKNRLIEIAADGKIDHEELKDFIAIQEELERISITVETLQVWSERMIATGAIDLEQYEALKK